MADEQRLTHIFRVIGKSPSGDVKDAWLDIERSEFYTLVEGGGPNWQRRNVKLNWYLDGAGQVPNPSRKTTPIRIIPPDEDLDNPQLWFEVDLIDAIEVREHDQIIVVHFDNSADNFGRKVEVRRVVHFETSVDDRYPDGGVIPKNEYQKIAATKDKSQHLDVEFIQKRAFRDVDQIYAIAYNNQPLIDAADLPDTSYGEGEINPPWRLDPLQNIVNVKVSTLYLVVTIAVSNQSFSGGPYGAAPSVGTLSVSCGSTKPSDKRVKLLDMQTPPDGDNSTSGFLSCFDWFNPDGGLSAQEAWILYKGGHGIAAGEFFPTDGACPWPGGGGTPEGFEVVPVDFQRSVTVSKDYLFRIPADDGVVTIDVEGLLEHFDSGPDDNFNHVTKNGGGTVGAAVYSTVKGKITKLSQLIDYGGDGQLRPTQDDTCVVGVDSTNQGKFQVNIKLDKDKSHAQIDNYGKTFQPYKVTLTPGPGTDIVPGQPPPRLSP